jgi:hypothetical protein
MYANAPGPEPAQTFRGVRVPGMNAFRTGTFPKEDACFFLRLMECYGYGQKQGFSDSLGRGDRGDLLGRAVGARGSQHVGSPRVEEPAAFLGWTANA